MLVEGLKRLGLPFVVLSSSAAVASACTSGDVLSSPAAARGSSGDAAPKSGDAGSAEPDATTDGGRSDGSVVFPEIRTGSLPPDGTEPPAPVDDCASLDPKGVQVLAKVCPAVLAIDDDWV